MLSNLRIKVKALVEDLSKTDFEVFSYENSTIFTLSEPNISTITKVLKNGINLGSGDYSYDSTTNKIEITASLTQGDLIEVDYIFSKYSDTELNEYIRASLVWISVINRYENDFELEEDANIIVPTPNNSELDLIALVAAIIIKPNYNEYRLPNLTVRYPRTMSKEDKIQRIVSRFSSGIGIIGTINWN